MEKKELTCIGCPMGCQINVIISNNNTLEIDGYTCEKGEIYARKEVTNPTRIVTSSVYVNGGDKITLSVKTANDIPKSKIIDVIKELKNIKVNAPIKVGTVILNNVANTGVNVVATREIKKCS
ncbi:MAG: DUF1667 domain-containing protein [Eubacteriales bacterium]|nr:DUF1667 domain-containing protein [Eubacteriales bacterium]